MYRVGNVSLEWMARNLSVLQHEQGIVSKIPENITFYEMYGIQQARELNAEQRWKKSQSHKSLAVPLGVRGNDEYVYLNLHEKAHGPHGLVAGTTGSGKSIRVKTIRNIPILVKMYGLQEFPALLFMCMPIIPYLKDY